MDEILGGMGCGLKDLMKDSIMMDILHSAMSKAHEKLQNKEGIIGRLIEISKFYELAVMELDGCLKIVQRETDSFALETGHEEVLSDLFIIRDRLQGRLEEMEFTISNKDRELAEKLHNEFNLRQALELKERELVSLLDTLDLGKEKGEEGFVGREVEVCELKSSVEEKVLSFKQKFLDGKKGGLGNSDPDYEKVNEEDDWRTGNKKIEQMSLDIDNLKETLDIAFEKMRHSMFLSEQQWGWAIERETVSIVTKGFMRDLREIFETEERKHEKAVGLMATCWSDLMNAITTLHSELENISCRNEVQPMKVEELDKKEENFLSRGIQEVVVRLDNLINWNAKMGETLGVYEEGNFSEKTSSKSNIRTDVGSLAACSVQRDSFSAFNKKDEILHNEVKELTQEIEDRNLLSVILEETYFVLYRGLMEDFYIKLHNSEIFSEELVSNNKSCNSQGEEGFIKKLDSLLQFLEMEENLIPSASPDMEETELDNIGIKDEKMDDWGMLEEVPPEEESNFNSVSSKLEQTLLQLNSSKTLLHELGSSFGVTIGDGNIQDQMNTISDTESDGQDSFKVEDNEEGSLNQILPLLSSLIEFPQVFSVFERTISEKLCPNMLRLQELKHQYNFLAKHVAFLSEKEKLYRKAFISRCHNLQKAETEVDLLADQVDVLLGLLEKIYITLHHYSPAMQQHFWVSDILNLIKGELTAQKLFT